MKEDEWLVANRPWEMLSFLQASGPTSERKLRLFGCACVRRVWRLVSEQGRAAVSGTERYADGDASLEQMLAVSSVAAEAFYAADARHVMVLDSYRDPLVAAERAAACVSSDWSSGFSAEGGLSVSHSLGVAVCSLRSASLGGMRDTSSLIDPTGIRSYADPGELLAQAALLRDIFGPLPF